MDKLIELLNNIADSYYDFVVSVVNYAKRKESSCAAMIAFIQDNPNASSADVIEYMVSRIDYFDHAERVAGVSSTAKMKAEQLALLEK